MTGRIMETGIGTRFLNASPEAFPEFQPYKNRFPMSIENYLWKDDSPLHALGGLHDSLGLQASFNKAVFSQPANVFLFAKAGVKSGLKQLFLLDQGDGLSSAAFPQLCFYPENQAEYRMSRQFSGINFEKLNTWTYAFLAILIAFFIMKVLPQGLSPELKQLGIFIVLLLLVNALVNGALATPLNRYQVRVFWLVYFWLLAAAYPVLRSNFPVNRKSTI